jgi:hypothetical protein
MRKSKRWINEIYHVAGNWVKPTSRSEGGTSATYVTIEEHAALKRHKEQEKKAKGKGSKENEKGAKTPDPDGQEKKAYLTIRQTSASYIPCYWKMYALQRGWSE